MIEKCKADIGKIVQNDWKDIYLVRDDFVKKISLSISIKFTNDNIFRSWLIDLVYKLLLEGSKQAKMFIFE